MYSLTFSKHFTRLFGKLRKKSKRQSEAILKKIREIKANPTHFKPLSNKLKGYWRIHIDHSFVLVYKVKGSTITICDYDHHNLIYQKVSRMIKKRKY